MMCLKKTNLHRTTSKLSALYYFTNYDTFKESNITFIQFDQEPELKAIRLREWFEDRKELPFKLLLHASTEVVINFCRKVLVGGVPKKIKIGK